MLNSSRRDWLKMAAIASALPATGLSQVREPLLTKKIPSSGESIPIVGIGTNRYGVTGDDSALQPLKEVLRVFAASGGGLIDTAPSYRNSESVLGQLFSELGLTDQFFIATKCDVSGGGETQQQIMSSESNLKSGKLDLVAVHNLKNWQQQLPVLQAAKKDQRIKYVGITTSRDRQYAEFKKILESERLDFMQINYSLGDRKAEPLLELAHQRGIAVMVNLAFGRGKLFAAVKDRELPPWAADFDARSWAQFFLKYVVSHPAVVCVIPGTTKLRHLEDNLGAALGRLPDAQQRQQMEQYFIAL